jgi:hypothetical protein
MEKRTTKRGMSDANFLLDDLKDLIEDLRNNKEQNIQIGLQLREQSAKASNSKSLLDTEMDESGSMVDTSIEHFTFSDDLISFPSKEDPVSITEEVCPGT